MNRTQHNTHEVVGTVVVMLVRTSTKQSIVLHAHIKAFDGRIMFSLCWHMTIVVVLVRMIKKDHLHGVGFLFHRTLPIIHHRLGVDVLDPPVDGRQQQVQDDPKRGNSGGDPKRSCSCYWRRSRHSRRHTPPPWQRRSVTNRWGYLILRYQ